MTSVTLNPKYVSILQELGDLDETLEDAVRRYAIERIGEQIGRLQHEIMTFQKKYGLPYEQFYSRITTDEEFVNNLRGTDPAWERDFNAWEYYVQELLEWFGRLESISQA